MTRYAIVGPGLTTTIAIVALLSFGCQRDAAKLQLPGKPAAAVQAAAPVPRETPASAPAPEPAAAAAAAPNAAANAGEAQAAQASSAAADGTSLLSGTTEPHRRSMLMPTIGGPVSRVLVRAGQHVKRGEPVVMLNTEMYRLGLRQAEAARKLGQAQVDATRVEWRRLRGLVDARAVPRSKFEQLDAQLKVGLAGLEQAEVAIALARKNLREAVVRAPFAGLITQVFVEEGEWVATMPPSRLVVLEQIDTLDLRVQVPETAMRDVQAGTPVFIHFTAIGRKVAAKVTRTVPSLDPRTRSFSAIVELPNADHGLRPGMFAEVRLGRAVAQQAERAR